MVLIYLKNKDKIKVQIFENKLRKKKTKDNFVFLILFNMKAIIKLKFYTEIINEYFNFL